jgi:acyl carrier protein
MSGLDIRAVLLEELGNIAPDIDIQSVDPKADLREALDIDSLDVLTFITAIHKRLGIVIPEIDYPKLMTFDGAAAYLSAKLQSR